MALIVLAVLLAACGSSDDEGAAPTTEPTALSFAQTTTTTLLTTTTTEPPTTTESTIDPNLPIGPLTGLPVEAESFDPDRPALAVKIDNHPLARPQTALDQADIVFDLRAEGVTRFTAVFHSRLPDPVGPVRSSRTSDFDLLLGLNNPLYGSSGGNDYVIGALRNLDVQAVTNQNRREYFRDGSRPAPHNLYVNATDLMALADDDSVPPEPWFDYRGPGEELSDDSEAGLGEITIAFTGGPTVGFRWDPVSEGWLRSQNGAPHVTRDGVQIAPANVVIMETTYGVSAADPISPELNSTGSGSLVVLTAGHVLSGTWERPTATDRPILLDTTGAPITLTAGQTWVLYPQAGQIAL